jgi:predicted nuclease with TOPRIM domain
MSESDFTTVKDELFKASAELARLQDTSKRQTESYNKLRREAHNIIDFLTEFVKHYEMVSEFNEYLSDSSINAQNEHLRLSPITKSYEIEYLVRVQIQLDWDADVDSVDSIISDALMLVEPYTDEMLEFDVIDVESRGPESL